MPIRPNMVPLGYMGKRVAVRPDWLTAVAVEEILSVSGCVSRDFADWVDYWKHNGYWLFDSPSVIQALALEHGLEISDCRWFYYEAHGLEYDQDARAWRPIKAEPEFVTSVELPMKPLLCGYDVVTYSCGNAAECSPLSCNHMAKEISTNRSCLLDSLDVALQLTESERFVGCEPGPFRIVAVYEVSLPPLG